MSKTVLKTLAASLFLAAPVWANPAMPLPGDASPTEAAAYAVLDKHCARCHQEGALKDGLTSAKSGFGHVLDIRRLAQDTKFVVQGNVMGSSLHNVIGEYSYPAMPDDCTDSSCFPTQAESDAVATWIEELANVAPPPRPFVSMAAMYEAAHNDILQQPSNRRDRIRYLSLRAIHNDQDVSDENVEGYKAATVKLINALSWNPIPFKAEPVDEHGVLIRIFLPELEWDHGKWHLLESVYPYGVSSTTDPHLTPLQHVAGTDIPVIRADWFAARASVSPLYYDILGLPDTVQGLERMLNLDMNRNILNEQVVRAGFQNSGVSTHNRLIERHALGSGFFWTSYDFAGSSERQSFFRYPLGPTSAYGPELAFHHDGGESIFTLPNGFHAYYLNTAEGARLDVGPTQIVRDDDYTDGTGEVVNGISCISCHSKGIRLNEDKVRDAALADLSFSPQVRQTIDATFPGQEVVGKWMAKDTEAFFAAMRSAGLDPEITAGGLEPVRGLFVYHVDGFINFAKAASELGLTEDELRMRVSFVGPEMAGMFLRLDQSPIARDEWTAAFPIVVERLTDYVAIENGGHVPLDNLSYSVRDVVHSADPDYKPTPTQYDNPKHIAPTHPGLTIYTDKPAYKVGDGMRIYVEPRHDCRLTLINFDDHHQSCVLYPHPLLPDVPIKGGTQYTFPPQGSLTANKVGVETILAICNASHEAISKITRDTSKVSCDVSQRSHPNAAVDYNTIIKEVLSLDLSGDTKVTDTGADYRGLSKHNPDLVKAQISAPVRGH